MGLEPGCLFTLKDDLILFPETRAGQERDEHSKRVVLLLSNEWLIESAKANPAIYVAPFSHKTHLRGHTDMIVPRSKENGLDKDSRLMLGHIQPMLREELEKNIGKLELDLMDEVKAKIVFIFGLRE